jgi:P4 family phage/plasmid primase-like protien
VSESVEGRSLDPDHLELLTQAAIAPEIARKHAYTDSWDRYGRGIVFRWQAIDDPEVVNEQLRPDIPPLLASVDGTTEDRRGAKYLFRSRAEGGTGNLLWGVRPGTDPAGEIWLVEGTKQVLAAASWAPPEPEIIGMSGCHGWRSKTGPVAGMDRFTDRRVVIWLDADAGSNLAVYEAGEQLGQWLAPIAAEIRFVTNTGGKGSEGIDDLLVHVAEDQRGRWLTHHAGKAGTRPASRRPGPKTQTATTAGGWTLKLPGVGLDSLACARAVLDMGPLRIGPGGMLWSYAGGVWQADRDVVIHRVAELLGSQYRSGDPGHVTPIVMNVLRRTGQTIDARPVTEILNFDNGLYHWPSGTMLPHDPGVPTTVQLGCSWDPEATCPRFDRFLTEVVEPDAVGLMWELVAYLMLPGNPFHRMVMLIGSGRNGKTVFENVVRALLGPGNTSQVSLHMLAENRFAPAELHGKIANLGGEVDGSDLRRTNELKALTGDNLVMAERKNRDPFEFTSWAVPMFSANELPGVNDASEGFFSRWLPIVFPYSFIGREDPRLTEALLAELPGIAARAVPLIRPLLERDRFTHSPALDRANARLQSRMNQFYRFAQDQLVFEQEARISRADLRDAYRMWAMSEEVRHRDAQRLYDWVRSQGAEDVMIRGNRLFHGVRLRGAGDFEGGPNRGAGVGPSDGPTPPSRPESNAPTSESNVSVNDFLKEGTGRAEVEQPEDQAAPIQKPPSTRSFTPLGADGAGSEVLTLISTESQNSEENKTHVPYRENELACSAPSVSSDPIVLDLETGPSEHLHAPEDPDARFVRLVGHRQGPLVPADEEPETVLAETPDELVRAIEQSTGPVVGHNLISFDLPALARHGLDLDALTASGRVLDTLLIAKQLDPPPTKRRGRKPTKYDLDSIGERLQLGGKLEAEGGETALKKLARKHGGYDKIPTDDETYRAYLVRDIELGAAVAEALLTDPAFGRHRPYLEREHRIAAITARMTANGFRIDPELLAERVADGNGRRQAALSRLQSALGVPTEAKAPLATLEGQERLAEAFQTLGVPEGDIPRTPKSGKLSITADAMTGLAEKHPQVQPLTELISIVTGTRTIYDTISHHTIEHTPDDIRVHPRISPEQSTGRWSVTEPGLTVIGKRGGRVVEREVFIPDEGQLLISVDLAQVDARAVAALSQDPHYIEMFAPGRDLHAEVADRVWGDPARREAAKAIGHGWNYGMGIASLARNAGVEESAARQFDEAMRVQFPQLVAWRDEVRAIAASGALLDNGWGRMMRPDPDRAHTQGPAFMGQGAARDILAEGLLRLPAELLGMLRVVVHDEIVLSAPAELAAEISALVADRLSFEWRGVPILADAGTPGANWAAAYGK